MARKTTDTRTAEELAQEALLVSGALDERTYTLRLLADISQDTQKQHQALENRFREAPVALEHAVKMAELQTVVSEAKELADKMFEREFRDHLMYPWLKQFPGMGGPLAGRILAVIGDPRRFPGQQCTLDPHPHTMPNIFDPGAPCPGKIWKNKVLVACPGVMQKPRRAGKGIRSLWHYFGLHVVDGKRARKKRGQQADWNPYAQGLVLAPNTGLGSQIVRAVEKDVMVSKGTRKGQTYHRRGNPYRKYYEVTKARKLAEGKKPYEAEGIAKTVAVKRFLGDLLMEWKALAA